MFSNILGNKDSKSEQESKENDDLIHKISTMNLTDMRLYVNNKMNNHNSNEEGLVEIMKRLTTKNEDTSKRYIEIDDMESKIKKAFELVLIVANHKKISVPAVELIQKFIELYGDVIQKYDIENKQIYGSKLKDSLSKAISTINLISEFQKKMGVLGN
jgi:ribonuclease HII